MIHRAMEMLKKLEESFIWWIYQCLLAIYTVVAAVVVLFAHMSVDNGFLDRFNWSEYFNILCKVVIPYGLTVVIRLVAAINYIIFENEG